MFRKNGYASRVPIFDPTLRARFAVLWALGWACAVSSLPAGEAPRFISHTIATGLPGAYQVTVADLNNDGKPDVIALATEMSELVWFENPGWQRHLIASNFDRMINCVVLKAGASPAIVLASGFSMNPKTSPGNLWLLTAGKDVRLPWNVRAIDRLPASHRLRLADVDGSGVPVVIDAPLANADASPPNYRGHTPLVFYRPGEWRRRLVSDLNEGVQHGLCIVDWDGNHRDDILTASFVGVDLFRLEANGRWTRTPLVEGDPAPWPKCGAGEIAVGRLSGSRFLCTIEPWHGNELVVYHPAPNQWHRQVLDNTLNEGHALLTADLNRDGRDEIVAGYRGKGGGLVLYTAEDNQGWHWTRHDIDMGGIATSSCAISDLNGDGRPDIVAIGSATANLKWYENRN